MGRILATSLVTVALGACAVSDEKAQQPDAFAAMIEQSSGCLADEGALPDGAWFGMVAAWDGASIDLDPACFLTGEAAAAAAAKRGDESPPPNDFYIVNDTKLVRNIPVAAGATATRVTHDSGGGITTEATTYADLVVNSGTYMMCPGADSCPVWIRLKDGAVQQVMMQYLP